MSKASPTIASEAARLLAEHGPMDEAELTAELVRSGRTKARQPQPVVAAALQAKPGFIRLLDGRWTYLTSLLEGSILRHRLSEIEVARGVVDADPDLTPLVPILNEIPTTSGATLTCPSWFERMQDPWFDPDEPWRRRILGVLPWLDGQSAGEVVEFRIRGGRLEIEIVGREAPSVADVSRVVARIAGAARRVLAVGWRPLGEPGVEIAEVVATAVADDPTLLTFAGLPLGEVLEQAEFRAHARFVGPAEADWAVWDERERSFVRQLLDRDRMFDEAWAFEPAPDASDEGIVELESRRDPGDAARTAPARVRLRVELDEMDPPVWRRIEVPGDITLARLHRVILLAMGWIGGHLYEFRIGDVAYGEPDEDWDPGMRDDRRVRLDGVVAAGDTIEHHYDFGDGWCHLIRIEEVHPAPADGPARSRCLDGSGTCPPEDCGGPYGYRELRRALTRPRHGLHAEALERLGEDFDAAAFDIEETNQALGWAR